MINMGCCGNRGSSEFEMTEEVIMKFESSLPISKHRASSLIELFQKSITKRSISEVLLAKSLNSLKIEKTTDLSKIIQNFAIDENSYSSQKLFTFVLLLAKGEKQEKVNLLFENYLPQNKKVLENSEINQMIQDIYQIVLLLTPRVASWKVPGNVQLERYRIDLSSNQEYIIHYLMKCVDDNVSNKKVTLSSFVRAFSFKEVECLLNPSHLRQTVNKLLKTMLRAQMKVDLIMNAPDPKQKNLPEKCS
jgi:hypothetical protein